MKKEDVSMDHRQLEIIETYHDQLFTVQRLSEEVVESGY